MTDQITQGQINQTAWAACDTFRGVVDAGQYKDYILVMLFLKYISDHWNDHVETYRQQFGGDDARIRRRLERERFILPEGASFYDLYAQRNEANIGELINVVCGTLLIELAGTEPVFRLSVPRACRVGTEAWSELRDAPDTDAFLVDDHPLLFRLVDMPGYGYAKAPKDVMKQWRFLVNDYLRGRAALKRTLLLIDARHGIKDVDRDIMKMLDDAIPCEMTLECPTLTSGNHTVVETTFNRRFNLRLLIFRNERFRGSDTFQFIEPVPAFGNVSGEELACGQIDNGDTCCGILEHQ